MGILNHQGLPVVSGAVWPGVRYFTTTRYRDHQAYIDSPSSQTQGFATPYAYFNLGDHVGEDDKVVQANRSYLADALPGEPLWLKQVHGTEVLDADEHLGTISVPQADAAVTSRAGQVLCIMTADCLPVVVSNARSTVLGVAHAGWRGLAAGVLENMFALLQRKAESSNELWRAWIGPAIGRRAFEVGDEVQQAFIEKDAAAADCFEPGARPGKWQADLPRLALRRLHEMGVEQVEIADLCTHACADAFYSYRRDGPTGRMATLAWLNPTDLP